MWSDLLNSPLLSGLIGGILVAAAGWTTAFFNRGKQRAQLILTQQEQVTALAMAEAKLRAELEQVRLHTQIDVAKQAHAQTLALEAAKAEQLLTQQSMAMVLAAATNEQRQAATAVTAKLSDIAAVTQGTHDSMTGTRTAMALVEQDLRNKLQLVELTARAEAQSAALQMAAEREKVAGLVQQLAAMTPVPVPVPVLLMEQPPVPLPVIVVDEPAAPAEEHRSMP